MSVHTAKLSWTRGEQSFGDGKYSRVHDIAFDGGAHVPGSPAVGIVRAPMASEEAVDPEEMLVAALSSCHLLFFLDFARRGGFVVDSYVDDAEGLLEKRDDGKMAVTKVTLKPKITWSGEKVPTPEDIAELHHKTHEVCFIANSFNGEMVIA